MTTPFYCLDFIPYWYKYPSIKGLVVLHRNKNMPLIILLCISLLIVLMVNAILNIKIYIVYSTGLGPLLIIGLIMLTIMILYLKGYK